jgi:hypothetical protein
VRRMNRLAKVGVLGVVALLVGGLAPAVAQPGPGGPGGGGGFRGGAGMRPMAGRMMQMLYLERAWIAVSFGLDATEEQVTQLRPVFQAAWDTRKKAIEETAGGDRAGRALALSEANDQIRRDIDNGLAAVLSEEQLAKWDEMKTNPQLGGFGLGLGMGMMGPGGAAPAGGQP